MPGQHKNCVTSHGLSYLGPMLDPLTEPLGARELYSPPREVGSRGRLSFPSSRKPKALTKLKEEKKPCGGIGIWLPRRGRVWHTAFLTRRTRHRSRAMPDQHKNCVIPMGSHFGAHVGSPHEVSGRTRAIPAPDRGRQPRPTFLPPPQQS